MPRGKLIQEAELQGEPVFFWLESFRGRGINPTVHKAETDNRPFALLNQMQILERRLPFPYFGTRSDGEFSMIIAIVAVSLGVGISGDFVVYIPGALWICASTMMGFRISAPSGE